jgi:hypothetical protein
MQKVHHLIELSGGAELVLLKKYFVTQELYKIALRMNISGPNIGNTDFNVLD